MKRETLAKILAPIIYLIGYLVGGFDNLTTTLLLFMVFDFIMGLTKASKDGTLSSNIGFTGIIRKVVGTLIAVAVAVQTDILLDLTDTFRNLTLIFLIVNEGLSVLENLESIGIKVPDKLKDKLQQLIDKEDLDED